VERQGQRVDAPLRVERHRRILEVLHERDAVRVSALSDLLGVSEVTVRRDLEGLERRGLLERTHGGAVSVQRMRQEPRYVDSITVHPEEKRLIGRAAAALVEPGDTVFLNSGTTTLEVFRHIAAPAVKVITNSVGIAVEASGRDVELILVGGRYRAPSNSLAGPIATATLRTVTATRAFIGVEGVSPRSGITTPTAAEAEVARLMIERTRGEIVVVADHSKLGTVADFTIAELDRIGLLVVDPGVGGEYRQELADLGIELLITEEAALAGSRPQRQGA
jgi:DeoR family fructose operon transcriptional repressor